MTAMWTGPAEEGDQSVVRPMKLHIGWEHEKSFLRSYLSGRFVVMVKSEGIGQGLNWERSNCLLLKMPLQN